MEDDSGDGFDPKKPHFFQFIVAETIRTKKLMISEDFVKDHGDELGSPITIKLPGGLTWEIELLKEGNKAWLCNGTWKEFARHYSLRSGYHLAFQYEGCSRFSVLIFGVNGSQIQYPTAIPIHSSCSFTSDYPFFKVSISSSHLKRCNMHVPTSFSKKYLKGGQQVKLQVEERHWKVYACKYKGPYESLSVQLGRGFSSFAKENWLEVGDLCYFELVSSSDDDEQTLRVTVAKGDDGSS